MNELIKVWTLNHRQNPLLVRAKSVQQLNSRIAYFRHYVKALPLWGKDACLICWLPTRCLYGAKSSFIPQTFHIARPRKMLSLQERIKQIGLVGLYNFPCPIGAKGR